MVSAGDPWGSILLLIGLLPKHLLSRTFQLSGRFGLSVVPD
jgi:hypothetical protein